MNNNQHIRPLIRKFLDGSLSPSELEMFKFRLMDDPEFAREVHLYKKAFKTLRNYRQIELKASLQQIENNRERRRAALVQLSRVAAVFLVFISVAVLVRYEFLSTTNRDIAQINTENKTAYPNIAGSSHDTEPNNFPVTDNKSTNPVQSVAKKETAAVKTEIRHNKAASNVKDVYSNLGKTNTDGEVALSANADELPGQLSEIQTGLVIDQTYPSIPPRGAGLAKRDKMKEPFSLSPTVYSRATLKGRIADQLTNSGLPATIMVAEQGIVTDAKGNFELKVEPGDYTVIARLLGYEDAMKRIQAGPGKVLNLNLLMSASVTQLQTLTVTASKFERPLGEITASAEVISGKIIQEQSLNSVDNYLQKINGVNIIDGQISIRGGSGFSYGAGSRVLLLLDGMPALQGDAAFPDWDLMPVENADQVEVIKGAASALYGSSSLNGVINVRTGYPSEQGITRASFFTTTYFTPTDNDKKWWGADSETAAPFAVGLSFLHGKKIGDLDVIGGLYGYKDQSFREGAFSEYVRGHIKSRLKVNDEVTVGLHGNVQVGNSARSFIWKNWQDGAYESLNGTITENTSFRLMLDPFFTHTDTVGNQHKLLSRYYYWDNNQANASADQSTRSHQIFGEYQFQRHFDDSDLTITTGFNGSHTRSHAQLFGDTLHTATNVGAYVNVDQRVFERLNLSFGARLETNFFSGEVTEKLQLEPVFRIGANYKVSDQTYLRASWGQGYRAPTIAEKFISTSISSLQVYPNPDLEPERGWSGEIGIRQGFKTPFVNGFFDFSSFWMEYEGMMEFAFRQWGTFNDPLWGFGFGAKNVGNTRIRGVELGVTGEADLGALDVSMNVGYTYVDPKYKDYHPDTVRSSADYNVLKYRFRHTAKMNVELRYKKWSAGLGGQYYSFMEAIDEFFINEQLLTVANLEDLGIAEYRDLHDSGNFIVDAWLSYEPVQQLNLSLIGRNIFNSEYSMRPGILEAPANLSMRLSYRI
ncbi:MAG: TonB-dependent receptor [Bacteroidota bacterium]